MSDISKTNYADAGVSIKEQNEVNSKIKAILQKEGLMADGLFGGAIDISKLKDESKIPIGIEGTAIAEVDSFYDTGLATANLGLTILKQAGIEPLALLDYIAGPNMDKDEVPAFVKGVAVAGLKKGVPLIGGESAQMPGTYNEGKIDAYVHTIYKGERNKTIDIAPLIKNMKQPFLCGTTDGTGTKTRIVRSARDIIHHGSNDLGAIGVRPIAFSLYLAGNAKEEEFLSILNKSEEICRDLEILSLDATVCISPELYAKDQIDIAGTVIGVIDKENLITGENVQEGDVIIGIAADGLMTNGYSLARKYVDMLRENDKLNPDIEKFIHFELSRPHVPYTDILFGANGVQGLLEKYPGVINATSHITGGGQKDNIERMIPDGLTAAVKKEQLSLPLIVDFFKSNDADMDSMYEAFNMGVGFTLTVKPQYANEIVEYCNNNFARRLDDFVRPAIQIGEVQKAKTEEKFHFVN